LARIGTIFFAVGTITGTVVEPQYWYILQLERILLQKQDPSWYRIPSGET
jgi:hypothetical protein